MDSIKERKEKKFYSIEEFKKRYELLRKKHNLPSFEELNEFFDIEEIDDYSSDFLIRKIRRHIFEKIVSYNRLIETILNPSNAPIFFFNLIKKLDSSDKEILAKIYEKLGNIELETIVRDLEYSEEMEAAFIRGICDLFKNKIKRDIINIIKKICNENNRTLKEINGSYFG